MFPEARFRKKFVNEKSLKNLRIFSSEEFIRLSFIFTQFAEKKFKKLENSIQERVIQKLKQIKNHSHVFSLLVALQDFEPATHRLRVGSYRIILCYKGEGEFLILDVGHRKDIYE